jgi:glyoxylase I family protein
MKLTLHHVNFATTKVRELDRFYQDILGMDSLERMNSGRIKTQGYPGQVAFVSDGAMQIHIAERDMGITFRTGQAVNPVDRGHIAFRTDNIAAFKARLQAHGIPFADFGAWAMNGWEQIFFYDPDGNVVEVHQVHPGAQPG